MTITGKLNNGKAVLLDFVRNPGATTPPNTTNGLEAYLDGASGTAMSGTTTYNTQTKKADGTFSVTFPATGALTGSFSGVAVP
ncbi:hypothetical protein E5J99_11455 [Hymenobacter elongatus]|uniref:Uncharacterized protein n=1 Tax=Hymenobacter elongatus TaxID=877208 RepID=A0A4Z0PKZ4_9BACT|nr:hypothetical protein E5J99_11455 [Hymenobacter elongatus]